MTKSKNNNLSDSTKEKVAIYTRLSREDRNKTEKGDDSESIINQQIMLIEYCKKHDWSVYQIYNDEDFSGSDRDRPAFNRMLNDAKDKKFDIIICKTQSRFARDMEMVEKYINGLFPIWGIRFISIVDNADTSIKANRKSRQITSMVDQWMLEDLSENIKATLAVKRKQGLWVGAFAPYGYIKDPNNKNHLVIDPEAAQVVKYVFKLYIEGYGITSLARRLNDEGIPNPAAYKQQHGQPFQNAHKQCSDIWHTYTVKRMITNQIYLGHTVQGMWENISYKSNEKRRKPQDEWDIVKNTHEAIIDKETWDAAQAVLNSKSRSTKTGQVSIFARKLRCLKCNSSMRSFNSGRAKYFACHTAFFAKARCSGTYVSQKVLEKEVIKQIQGLYEKYIDVNEISDCINFDNSFQSKTDILNQKMSNAQAELTKLENRFKSLYYDKVEGILNQDDFALLSQDCKEKRTRLTKLIQEYKNELCFIDEQKSHNDEIVELIKQYKDIQTLDRTTVNALIDYIEIGGTKNNRIINIHWNF